MSSREFLRLIESLTKLKSRQPQQLVERAGKLSGHQEIQDLVSSKMEHKDACPHCGYPMHFKWRYAHSDEPRYHCKACAKTFTGLTGTQFSRIHHNALLLENATCMKDSLSVQAAARELGGHCNTSFRFRHLMKPILSRHQPDSLPGIAEADEMFFRLSFKEVKSGMPRKVFKRGFSVSKRGMSTERWPCWRQSLGRR